MKFQGFKYLYQNLRSNNPRLTDALDRIHDTLESLTTGVNEASVSGPSSTSVLSLSCNGTIAIINEPLSLTLSATGGTEPYIFSIIAGGIPVGMNLHPATGIIDGTPTAEGIASFTAQVTDALSNTAAVDVVVTVVDPSDYAPNMSSAGVVTVSYQTWGNATIVAFTDTVTPPASLGSLKTLVVYAVNPSNGKRIEIARYDVASLAPSTPFVVTGSDTSILKPTTNLAGWKLEYQCFNASYILTPSPLQTAAFTIPGSSITGFTVTDNIAVGARWAQQSGALQAQEDCLVTLANVPEWFTIYSVSPQYGTLWHKWYNTTTSPITISIGKQGTDTFINPPTVGTSEVVRFYCAPGTWDSKQNPVTIPGVVFYDVTVAGPPVPANNLTHGLYITTLNPSYGPGPDGQAKKKFGWQIEGFLPITAADSPNNFKASRLCIETGKYVLGVWTRGGQRPNPMDATDSRTVVGDITGPTSWYPFEDHADNVLVDPATGFFIWSNPDLWDVPSDGFPIFRYSYWVETIRNGGTWTQQATWSAAPGTSTPGTALYQEQPVDDSANLVQSLLITTADGTFEVNLATLGLIMTKTVAGITYVTVLNGQDLLQSDTSGGSNSSLTVATGSQARGKLVWDATGKFTKYANLTTGGKGVAPILPSMAGSGLSGGGGAIFTNYRPYGAVLAAGIYRCNLRLVCSAFDFANEASIAPSLSWMDPTAVGPFGHVSTQAAWPTGLANAGNYVTKLLCGNPTASPYAAITQELMPSVIVKVDGIQDLVFGLIPTGTWTTARFDYDFYAEQIA